jgi:hypothetical protein
MLEAIKIVGTTEILLEEDTYNGRIIWSISMQDIDTGERYQFGMTPKVGLGLADLIMEAGSDYRRDEES